MKVLVVDDDPEVRHFVESALRARSHEATAVGDATAGWEAYQRAPYPLLILDWVLPGPDGLSLCRRIRSLPAGGDTVILVITGRDALEDLTAVLAAGADDYLAKPFSLRLLLTRLEVAERRVRDVMERKQAEAELRESEARYRVLSEAAPFGIIQTDGEGRATYTNPHWQALAGRSAAASLGQGWTEAIHPDDREQVLQAWTETGATERGHEFRLLSASDEVRWVSVRTSPQWAIDGSPVGYVGMVEDVTIQKHVEEKERQLALLEERERIAMDLHDGLIQSLYGVQLVLEAQLRRLGTVPEVPRGTVEQAFRQFGQVIDEARDYMLSLRDAPTELTRIVEGTDALLDTPYIVGGRGPLNGAEVSVDLEYAANVRIDASVALHLPWIIREAIANVIRHSGASTVRVRLAPEADQLVVSIRDDGHGFDVARVDGHHGSGLRNIAKRTKLIGGTLTITSHPGEGTELRVAVPVKRGPHASSSGGAQSWPLQ